LSRCLELAENRAITVKQCVVAQLLLDCGLLLRRNADKIRNARWNLQFLYQIRGNSD
jgi:hypothetical protein